MRGIHQSPVNSPHKGQWRGALMFSLICAWINDWVNNREAGDLRRHHAHYDVIVVLSLDVPKLRTFIYTQSPRENAWPPKSESTCIFMRCYYQYLPIWPDALMTGCWLNIQYIASFALKCRESKHERMQHVQTNIQRECPGIETSRGSVSVEPQLPSYREPKYIDQN